MWLYDVVSNYGVALILFAIIVKVLLLPFQMKAKRGTMNQTRLQPQINELKKKHGANKTKLNEETMKLYKEEGVKPMSGCLWSLIPFPILLALYAAIRQPITMMMGVAKELVVFDEKANLFGKISELLNNAGFTHSGSTTYLQLDQARFISDHPELMDSLHKLSEKIQAVNFNFLGIDLGVVPSWKVWEFDWSSPSAWWPSLFLFLIPVISAAAQLVSTLIMKKVNPMPQLDPDNPGTGSMNTMMLMMPVISLLFGFTMPAAISIYWFAGSVLQTIQEVVLTKHYNKVFEREAEVKNERRRIREEEQEQKRLEVERLKAEGAYVNPNVSKDKLRAAERQERERKRAEWEKAHGTKAREGIENEEEPSKVGARQFARGRAYIPDRFEYDETETTDDQESDDRAAEDE
jgi:YidC/Oxa1 family membrane protein insertase